MTDFDTTQAAPEPASTILDTEIDGVKSGGGRVAPEPAVEKEPARKVESVRDSLEAEAKKLEANPAKDEDGEGEEDKEKPVKAEKAEKAEKAKAETVQKEIVPQAEKPEAKDGTRAEQDKRPSEGREIIEAPARLLPQSKELWKNVPHALRSDLRRIEEDREREVSQYRESHQFREELKEFEDLAKNTGTTVKQALTNYVTMEKAIRADPATGLKQLFQNLQMDPPQAIGAILRSAGVTPQQLVEHMQREPHRYSALSSPQAMPQMQPQQMQQQAENPEVSQLKETVEAMQVRHVNDTLIQPFIREYPEAEQAWPAIEEVLLSGILEKLHGNGLSPRDKLETALRMVNPAAIRQQQESVRTFTDDLDPPAGNLRGDKSIKSSPGAVTDVSEPEKKMSMRDMLEEEARKIARRA